MHSIMGRCFENTGRMGMLTLLSISLAFQSLILDTLFIPCTISGMNSDTMYLDEVDFPESSLCPRVSVLYTSRWTNPCLLGLAEHNGRRELRVSTCTLVSFLGASFGAYETLGRLALLSGHPFWVIRWTEVTTFMVCVGVTLLQDALKLSVQT